jgi:hypothetical protein
MLKTDRIQIQDVDGSAIPDSQALILNTNIVAWVCVSCRTLLASHTQLFVPQKCETCNARYTVASGKNVFGRTEQGEILGVRRLPD